ncbi:hemerythrin domain-containing protein [Sedimenticola selenatireducens]|uniref:Hemerythrin HHE cation-binding protein n=1 Tax=Sedimenticola selenatireducens TaxID=191960 RepID=A0A2N6CX17_9GAMM|nr:hemerythrin domain-containing protein [Sedimenticola selenatireducens]PLX61830.1 MAG: hemerythrin HHE cation-binding protein [Sedimenticola selenatireducens]
MFSFFKRKQKPLEPTSEVTAPDTTISYDADLIDDLKEDHKTLLMHYMQVEKSARAQNFSEVRAELNHFKNLFHQHILLENVKLYVYLTHCLESNSEQYKVVKKMRTDMRHIGKAVNQFIDHYDVWPWDEGMETQFLGELEQIGSALAARIKTEEEDLYPLYDIPRETA